VLLACLMAANAALWLYWPPDRMLLHEVQLSGPYLHDSGHAFVADMPVALPSDGLGSENSRVELYEQGVERGIPHTTHDVIRSRGAGGFSHWGDQLYFSASDNSDPNVNGRTYVLRYGTTLPVVLYIGLLLLDFLVVAFVIDRAGVRRPDRRTWVHAGVRMFALSLSTVLLIQALFWVLTERALAEQGRKTAEWFRYVFHEGAAMDFAPGESVNFSEHQYLNYALNPQMPYGNGKQFNAAYRIRRGEPIRPPELVRWRALVLGGSTTFGELIPREEDTWVYQLERRVRSRCGEACEVINGGVGGYTVLENSLHYLILLNELQPDLVLLYEGINDVDARLFGVLTPDYSNYRIPWRSEGSVLPRPNPILASLSPYRYYFLTRHIVHVRRTGIGGVVSPPRPSPSEWSAALDRNRSDIYRGHLRNLIHLLQGEKRRVVVLPQYFTAVKEGDEVFARGVREHNEVNRAVAEEFQTTFLRTLAEPGTFVREDTFDNCHFNERGSIRMAEEVFRFLEQRQLLPPSSRRGVA
jgi:lysophospholipase L1-like esterase